VPGELQNSFVSMLSARDVSLEDISDLVGHSSTSVTETVCRHEVWPALIKGAICMNLLKAEAAEPTEPRSGEPIGSRVGSRTYKRKVTLTSRDGGI
jgi:hypothetical protein